MLLSLSWDVCIILKKKTESEIFKIKNKGKISDFQN